tara:strand:- start:282 stop:986 length:705 start_codon:yes stop_codon:yes gene_type:complete
MAYVIRKPNLMLLKLIDKSYSFISHKNLINLKNNYIYIDIPKCGSSFIKSTIISEGDSLMHISNFNPHSALFKRPFFFNSIEEKSIITFIKDPIERFLSVVREKFWHEKFVKNGWNPSKFHLYSKPYKLSNIDEFIEEVVDLPLNNTDKHLIPQNKFIKNYFNHEKLKIFHVSHISKILLEIGISNSSFPDNKIALKTDSNLFNINNLSNKSISRLKSYYAEDYKLFEKLNTEL